MKKIFFVFFMIITSLTLVACTGSKISAEELMGELEGVTLKEEGVFEAGLELNIGTEFIIFDTPVKKTNKIIAKVQSDLLNTIVDINSKQTGGEDTTESSAKIYVPEGNFAYVDTKGDLLAILGIEEGKFKLPVGELEESIPPIMDELPIDPGIFDSFDFLDKFEGINFYKSGSKITIKVDIDKKVLLKNVDLIIEQVNKTFDISLTKEEFTESLNQLKDFKIKLEIKIVDKEIKSFNLEFKLVMSVAEEKAPTISIDGKLNFKYISKMPKMPNFDDFILVN